MVVGMMEEGEGWCMVVGMMEEGEGWGYGGVWLNMEEFEDHTMSIGVGYIALFCK